MFKIVAAVLIVLGAASFLPPVRRKLRSLGE